MNPWQTYQEQHKDRFLEELLTLLRIPSISAKTEHNADMMACAQAETTGCLRANHKANTSHLSAFAQAEIFLNIIILMANHLSVVI